MMRWIRNHDGTWHLLTHAARTDLDRHHAACGIRIWPRSHGDVVVFSDDVPGTVECRACLTQAVGTKRLFGAEAVRRWS